MIRDEMIQHMIDFAKSTPKDASDYHRMDMLLSRMQRLGMIAPQTKNPKYSSEEAKRYAAQYTALPFMKYPEEYHINDWDETDDN